MKNILFTTLLVASFGATSAHANEVFTESTVISGLSKTNADAVENYQDCMQAEPRLAVDKAIRACTKAYKASIPNHEIRSNLLTRRGWLRLSSGQFDRAIRDFKSAATLNNDNELAFLGEGFAAMLDADYKTAVNYFNDCRTHDQAAPLAIYGLAMTKELTGDKQGAISAYQQASKMSPEWEAPRAELKRMRASS